MSHPNQIITGDHLGKIKAYIAEHSVCRGTFTSDPDQPENGLRIDGVLEGSIRMPAGGVVHIGPTGKVSSKNGVAIEADIIYVEGDVDGHLVARQGIEVAPSADVRGEIRYHRGLAIQPLAKIRGGVTYVGEER